MCLPQEDIIIDAKSGVSGAGRSVKQAFLYTEVAEGMNAYGVSRHRHMPEIEQVTCPAKLRCCSKRCSPHAVNCISCICWHIDNS